MRLSSVRRLFGSLSVQLVAILLVALVLSQVANIFLFADDRRRALRFTLGTAAIARTVVLMRSLDNTNEAERAAILASARSPFYTPTLDKVSRIGPEQNESGRLFQTFQEEVGQPERTVFLTFSGGRSTDRKWWRAQNAGKEARAALRAQVPRGKPPRKRIPMQHFMLAGELGDGTWLNVMTSYPRPPPRLIEPNLLTSIFMSLAILAAGALSFFTATRSLTRLERAATRFSRGAEVNLLEEKGPGEVRSLIRAFNNMQERLAGFVRDRTRMLASISHDLRTPITAMRLRVELLEDSEDRRKLIDQLDQLQQMSEATLEFARDDASPEPARKTDITALADAVADDFRQMGQQVEIDIRDRIVVECKPLAIRRLLQNLIGNSITYGGDASVRFHTGREHVEIIVEDRGPGIPDDRIEEMFKPFSRIDPSRSRETGGTGLGLSIARSIARSHGGDLTIANRAIGGLCATVRLPLA